MTVGASHGGEVPNVIPGEVGLRLTVWAFKSGVQDLLERRITDIAHAQAAVFGTTADVNYTRRNPVLVNYQEQTRSCRQGILDWLGPEGMDHEHQPSRGSADSAFFLEQVPGCRVGIGNGLGDDGGCGLDNAGYDFNDPCLSTSATCWVKLGQACLGVGR